MYVSLSENEREGEVRETKKVLGIGIFLAKHLILGVDSILWYCWVLCLENKKVQEF